MIESHASRAVPLASLLLTLATSGCVMSEVPLTTREEGFVDHALVGSWFLASPAKPPSFDKTPDFRVSIDDKGVMTIEAKANNKTNRGCHTAVLYTAYSSRLGRDTYLNARFVGCKGQPGRPRGPRNTCGYYLVRYAVGKYLRNIHGKSARVLRSLSESFPGRLGAWNDGSQGAMESAIQERRIEGRSTKGKPPCLTAAAPKLRRFVRRKKRKIFPADSWNVYVRMAKP